MADEVGTERSVFTSSLEPKHTLHAMRLWLADTLDLVEGLLAGWGLERSWDAGNWRQALLVIVGTWVVYGTATGAAKQTLWRWVFRVSLQTKEGRAPGLIRAFVRTLTLVPDHVMLALFRFRPLDRLLRLRPQVTAQRGWRRLAAGSWHLPAMAVVVTALYFVVTPTRSETLRFLNTLDGWRCCHGRLTRSGRCALALDKLTRDKARGDAEAIKVFGECPEAARRAVP